MIKVIFFGTGSVAAASLESLVEDFSVEYVITKARPPHHKDPAPVEELASRLGLTVLFANTRNELDEIFDRHHFSSELGIIVDHGVIVSQKVIDTFKYGIINSHFSLLPQWRGADPITYTILSGQEKTGVSLMVIDAGLDTGKLIAQKSLHVDLKETTGTLTEKLITLSNSMIKSYLPRYIAGDIIPKNQPHPDRASHSHKISKADSIINWNEPAVVIERKIRAFQPWPKARVKFMLFDFIVLEAEVSENTMGLTPGQFALSKELVVGCNTGSLSIKRVQPLGKKEMPISAFLAGYGGQLRALDNHPFFT